MDDATRVIYILGGHPKCYTEGCMHLRRGIRDSNGIRYSPGIYCACCAHERMQGAYDSDAFNCDGTPIKESV